MRILIVFITFVYCQLVCGQNLKIAQNYYNSGKFNLALSSYKSDYQKNPNNTQALLGMVNCYRQLNQFPEAITLLQSGIIANPKTLILSAELGITYFLNKEKEKARKQFEITVSKLDKQPNFGTFLAQHFLNYNLLKPAIACYKKAMQYNPLLDLNYNIGLLYGKLSDYENMFIHYLECMHKNLNYTGIIKRRLDEFITEDPENKANVVFRKTLLKKNQLAPDILYNELLSWLFTQQKQFKKAFLQEKAIYKKTDEGIPQLMNLATTSKKANDNETAIEILDFIIKNSNISNLKINAHRQLLSLKISDRNIQNYPKINAEYQRLIAEFGENSKTLGLLLDYGHFLAFTQNKKKEANKILEPLLKLKFTKFERAEIELLIGDVFILDNKFNKGLVHYTRAQKKLKNHPLSQQANFKIAKASYYKGDFNWAKTQLNVLKAATSHLFANDAMALALVIEDNTKEDSTHTALKLFAKAELYKFQEQPEKALQIYQEILNTHKNTSIEDDALFAQASLFHDKNETKKAIKNLEKIVELYPTSLLIDDTFFKLGTLYNNNNEPEKAKNWFEKIIFDHADSIHYVSAQKAYRKLRGDTIIN